ALSAVPTAPEPRWSAGADVPVVDARLAGALHGVAAGLAVAIPTILVNVYLLHRYSTSLFLGTPFTLGAVSAYVFNRDAPPGARADRAVRGGRLRLDRGARRHGLARRGELQRARPADGGPVPARHRLPPAGPDRGDGAGRDPPLRVLDRHLRGADHAVGGAPAPVVRHHRAAGAAAGALTVRSDRAAAPGGLFPRAPRRIPVGGPSRRAHVAHRQHLVRARHRAARLLGRLRARDCVGDSPPRAPTHQTAL